METQESFSVLLLSSEKKKEEVRDSAAKYVQDEEVESDLFQPLSDYYSYAWFFVKRFFIKKGQQLH